MSDLKTSSIGERVAEKLEKYLNQDFSCCLVAEIIDLEVAPLIEASFEDVSMNLAQMVTNYVENGIKGGTDWRNGLADIIALRLKCIQMSKPATRPA